MQRPGHCLSHLIPVGRLLDTLRPRGHNFVLLVLNRISSSFVSCHLPVAISWGFIVVVWGAFVTHYRLLTNSLPDNITTATHLLIFRHKLKTFLFETVKLTYYLIHLLFRPSYQCRNVTIWIICLLFYRLVFFGF